METRLRILLVEDDFINALSLKFHIERRHDFHHASSRDEAYNLLYRERIDVALLDMNIDGESQGGEEILEFIRSTPSLKHIQVIAVTGYGTTNDTEQFKEKGFDDFFPKPLVIEDLLNKLSQLNRF
jgi:CheY-like chemotaxis protein